MEFMIPSVALPSRAYAAAPVMLSVPSWTHVQTPVTDRGTDVRTALGGNAEAPATQGAPPRGEPR